MSELVKLGLVVSEICSIFLILRAVKEKGNPFFKIVLCALVAIPFLGPLLYFFLSDEVKPQRQDLMNDGPKGDYTHHWISLEPLLRSVMERKLRDNAGDAHKDGESKGSG